MPAAQAPPRIREMCFLAVKHGAFCTKRVGELAGIASTRAVYELHKLREAGRVEMRGKGGRAGYLWRIPSDPA